MFVFAMFPHPYLGMWPVLGGKSSLVLAGPVATEMCPRVAPCVLEQPQKPEPLCFPDDLNLWEF